MIHDILTNPDLLAAVHAFLIALAVAVVLAVRNFVAANVSAKNLDLIAKAAQMAVLYAEQTGFAATGEQKLKAALQAADAFLAGHGIPVTAEELRAAIEAAVFNKNAAAPPK